MIVRWMDRLIGHWLRRLRARRIIRDFHRLYYEGLDGKPLYYTMSWLGVETLKCPLDLWIYQEILHRTRPEVIVETGVWAGGSALYLASICDLLGSGEILACDVNLDKVAARVHQHPRIRLFQGSSIDEQLVQMISQACDGRRTMVILDSDHSRDHVREELRQYAPLVTPGYYLICEDTNVNGHPVFSGHGPGPYEAVQSFLRETPGWSVDRHCERLLLSFNPRGYLQRES